MKLYEAPRGVQVRLLEDLEGPVSAYKPIEGAVYTFSHVDGMYSSCKDTAGRIVHIPAWAKVEVIK